MYISYFWVSCFGDQVVVIEQLEKKFGWVTEKEERNLNDVIDKALCNGEMEMGINRICAALGIPPVTACNQAVPLSDVVDLSKEIHSDIKFLEYWNCIRKYKEEAESGRNENSVGYFEISDPKNCAEGNLQKTWQGDMDQVPRRH